MREVFITFPPFKSNDVLSVNLAGVSYCDANYYIARNNSSDTIIEYIIAGKGRVKVNDDEFIAEAGDVYILPLGSCHEYASDGLKPWTKIWFNVSGQLLPRLLEVYGLSGIYHFKQCRVEELFKEGQAILEQKLVLNELKIELFFHKLIANISEQYYEKNNSPYSDVGNIMRAFLDSHIFENMPSLDELSQVANLSKAQMIRVFKQDFGRTPYDYLLERKIETAKVILKNSVKTVKSIAYTLSFSDEYYFSRLFSKRVGVSPTAYREE